MRIAKLHPPVTDLEILDIYGDPTGITLKLTTMVNPEFQKKARAAVQNNSERTAPQTVAEQRAEEVDLIATAVVGWTGVIDEDTGSEIPYSHEKAVEFLGDAYYVSVKAQVEAFASEGANFFRKRT